MSEVKHVMLDLETMGTDPYSMILSIGAAHFDPAGDAIRDSFEVMVDMKTSAAAGLRMDTDTVCWWMDKARNEARERWLTTLKFELPLALGGFSEWLAWVSKDEHPDPERPNPQVRIWGNGANFDNVLLACAYKAAKMDVPWRYSQDRCFRTLKSLGNVRHKPDLAIVAHTALSDAIHQAVWMQNIVRDLKLEVE